MTDRSLAGFLLVMVLVGFFGAWAARSAMRADEPRGGFRAPPEQECWAGYRLNVVEGDPRCVPDEKPSPMPE